MNFQEFCHNFNTIMALNNMSHLLDNDKSSKFYFLMQHMLEVNKSMNLTAIKEESAILTLHFADSLTVADFLPKSAKIIDVGCGAGFPSLPLGIARPDLSITALDSTEKRIKYVQETAKMLEIPQFEAFSARAEDAGRGKYRENFDFATARAVAALPVLAELCLPLVKRGGSFIAMKSKKGEAELKEAERAIKRLGGKIKEIRTIILKGIAEDEERLIIEIQKTENTPQELPRPYAKIVKKPL